MLSKITWYPGDGGAEFHQPYSRVPRSVPSTHAPMKVNTAGPIPSSSPTGQPTTIHSSSRQVAGSASSHRQYRNWPRRPLVAPAGRGRYGVTIVTPDH
jgi:hypothetical protein